MPRLGLSSSSRRVFDLAEEEARLLKHNYIGTEHLLLGLIREGGPVVQVLTELDTNLPRIREFIMFIVPKGEREVTRDITLTPRTKKVVELAIDEARRLHHTEVMPEHLMLGLVREGEGVAPGVLQSIGVNLEKLRQQLLTLMPSGQRPTHVEFTAASLEALLKIFEQWRSSHPHDNLQVFNLQIAYIPTSDQHNQ